MTMLPLESPLGASSMTPDSGWLAWVTQIVGYPAGRTLANGPASGFRRGCRAGFAAGTGRDGEPSRHESLSPVDGRGSTAETSKPNARLGAIRRSAVLSPDPN